MYCKSKLHCHKKCPRALGNLFFALARSNSASGPLGSWWVCSVNKFIKKTFSFLPAVFLNTNTTKEQLSQVGGAWFIVFDVYYFSLLPDSDLPAVLLQNSVEFKPQKPLNHKKHAGLRGTQQRDWQGTSNTKLSTLPDCRVLWRDQFPCQFLIASDWAKAESALGSRAKECAGI